MGGFNFFGGWAGCGERRLDIIQNMGRSPAVYRGHVDNRFLARTGELYSCDDCICLRGLTSDIYLQHLSHTAPLRCQGKSRSAQRTMAAGAGGIREDSCHTG